jgi:hypothetical protein
MSDGRHTVCVGGYSPSQERFIRIYPTKISNDKLERKNQVSVEVLKDSEDPREESHKMPKSKSQWKELHEKMEVQKQLDREEWIELIEDLPKDSIQDLKDQDRSMGLVEPEIEDAFVEERENVDEIQKDLNGMPLKNKETYPYRPKIKYQCKGNCTVQSVHSQQILEWGIYEFWRYNCPDRYPYDEFQGALNLFDDGWKHYFLVGNMRHHPTSFIVISDLRYKE